MQPFHLSGDAGANSRRAVACRDPRPGPGSMVVPQQVLNRLAKTIQLMRLDHVDAHLYRNGCDALVQMAIEGATTSELELALTDVMRHVEHGDYHWALMELRALADLERRAC